MLLANSHDIRTLQRWQNNWRQALEHVKPHYIPLAIVLLACAVGQAATLLQPKDTYQWPDTPTYMTVAQRILTAHQFADPLRTPGYPAFLSLIFALTGTQHYRPVVYAQAGLMVITAIEVYVLAYRLRGRRWAACLIAAWIGANLYFLDWERLVLSETLACWIAVTLFLFLERYLRTERTTTLIWLAVLSAMAILIRPIFIYLPAGVWLVLVFRSMRIGKLRQIWKGLALSLVMSYGLIVGYMSINAVTYGYFGLSDIGNLNLFAKVLELHSSYGMPVTGADPSFARFQADVNVYIASGHGSDVWAFVHTHPRWDAHYWSIYGAYSTQVLVRHPSYYLKAAYAGMVKAWTARPWFWLPFVRVPLWVHVLIKVSILQYRAYLGLPLLLLALTIWVWRRGGQIAGVTLLALLVCTAAQIVMAGAFDSALTEYDRLRFPFDWAMTFVASMVTVELIAAGMRALLGQGAAAALTRKNINGRALPAWLSDVMSMGMTAVLRRTDASSDASSQPTLAAAERPAHADAVGSSSDATK